MALARVDARDVRAVEDGSSPARGQSMRPTGRSHRFLNLDMSDETAARHARRVPFQPRS